MSSRLFLRTSTAWDGTNVYRYAVYGDSGNRTIEITYPNGAVYRQEARDGFRTRRCPGEWAR